MLRPANISPEQMPAMEAALSAAWAAKAKKEAEAEDHSYASAFLLEFRGIRGEHVQPLQLQSSTGQVFAANVQSLAFIDFLEMGVEMSRSGYGLHDVRNAAAQAALYGALFYVGLSEFANQKQRLFKHPDEAAAWMREPGFVEIPLVVRGVLLERNPILLKVLGPDGLEVLLSGPPE